MSEATLVLLSALTDREKAEILETLIAEGDTRITRRAGGAQPARGCRDR
jgi:hypothetical protein